MRWEYERQASAGASGSVCQMERLALGCVRAVVQNDRVLAARPAVDTPAMPAELTEAETSRFAQTSKWRIHYHEAGSGEPVILLHGSGPGATGWSNFNPNIAALAEHFRVFAVDMPGWGKSDTAVPGDRDHVEALILLMDELGLPEATLVGNSMGGMTSLLTLAQHPDRVRRIVTMGVPSPGVNIFGPAGLTEGLRILLGTYADPSPANFKRLVSIMAFDQKFATDELAEERSRNALANPDHLKNALASFRPDPKFQELGAALAMSPKPALVVHGRDDLTVGMEHGLRLVALMQNSRLLLLNRCGHWAQLEHADEFNRTVVDFIRHN